MSRFKKIGVKGKELPDGAKKWDAVLDTTTGLMWTVKEKKASNWKGANAYSTTLKIAGFTDWRMPTVEELFLLADRSRHNLAIDTKFFPDCEADWYWTSTPAAFSPGAYAWYVYFYYGYSYWSHQDHYGFVRACRASQ